MNKLKIILLMLFCTLFTTSGQTFYKLGASNGFNIIYLLLGLCFYGIGAVGLLKALKLGELSFVYPILALSYIWVTIISVVFFHESITLIRILGSSTIFLGVIILGVK
ncbi:MAG: EamA family transporter [Nanoarchaeota archaeon]